MITLHNTYYGMFKLYNKNNNVIVRKYGTCSQDIRISKNYTKIECFFDKKFLNNFINEAGIQIWINAISTITPVTYNGECKPSDTDIIRESSFVETKKENYTNNLFLLKDDSLLKFTIEVSKKPGSNLLGYTAYCLLRYLFWYGASYIPLTYIFNIYGRKVVDNNKIVCFTEVVSPFELIQLCHFINDNLPYVPKITGLYGNLGSFSNMNKFIKPITLEEFKQYSTTSEYINGIFNKKGFATGTTVSLISTICSNNLPGLKKIINE